MEYKKVALSENVEEMFMGPFGSSLKNECFVDEEHAYCMVYEQKHAIQKTMNVETRYVNEKKYNELKRFNIKGGDIIVSCRGTIGETFIVPEDAPLGIMHPSIMKIRLKDGLYDKYYFNSLLKMRLKKHETEANGSGIKMAISATELGKELFPLPSLDEQKRITNVLSGIENLICKRKEELRLLDELIKARFVELFGDPEENPLGWDKMPLANVIINANNGMARRGNDEGGNIVMRLVELQDGYIDYSNPNRIVLSDNEKKRYLLKDKDFLFARVNGNPDNVGRCAVFHDIGEEVYHNDHIIRVHFNERMLDGVFASALLNSNYGKRQLKGQIKTSAGQYTVSQDGIGAIVAILPSMELQEQFADFVKQVDKSKFRKLCYINF